LARQAEQLAAQGDRIEHGDQLSYLMETVALCKVKTADFEAARSCARRSSTPSPRPSR